MQGPRFESADDVARLEEWIDLVHNSPLSLFSVERTISMASRMRTIDALRALHEHHPYLVGQKALIT
ncbi:MAG: hypothetical protein ACRDQD_25010 [Nocardioidaceae bacterium]